MKDTEILICCPDYLFIIIQRIFDTKVYPIHLCMTAADRIWKLGQNVSQKSLFTILFSGGRAEAN